MGFAASTIIRGRTGWIRNQESTCNQRIGPPVLLPRFILECMKHLLLLAAGVATLATLRAAEPVGADARAHELIQTLHLAVLPKESGYLGLIGSSAQKIPVNGKSIAVQS